MATYAFRWKDDNGNVTYAGVAVAKSLCDLFWTVDEFGDPYSAEYCRLPIAGAICFAVSKEQCDEYDNEWYQTPSETPELSCSISNALNYKKFSTIDFGDI